MLLPLSLARQILVMFLNADCVNLTVVGYGIR